MPNNSNITITKEIDLVTPFIQSLPKSTEIVGRKWVGLILNEIYREVTSNKYWLPAKWVQNGPRGGYHPDRPQNPFKLRSFGSQPLRKAIGKWNIHPSEAWGYTYVDSLPGEKRPTMKRRKNQGRIKGPSQTDIYYRYLCRMRGKKYFILHRAVEWVEKKYGDKFGPYYEKGIIPWTKRKKVTF